MTFAHDVEHSLATVVDLVNTDPVTGGQELLPDVAALETFVKQYEISGVGELNDKDLKAIHAARRQLHEVFLAEGTEHAAELLNSILSSFTVRPRLTNHDGYDWHIHYFAPDARLGEHLIVDGGMALAFVLTAGEQERLQVCAAPDCRRVLVDLSRNRSKRYCDSRTCGNRLHVAAYRERQRAAAGG
ncbi:MAG TPA: CGNR zinc finger domain-containing protein [Jiangellaceae bacterium]|nr:CGNR zinc finger domain-containing protein [Jiangellaceae bacterium]